MARSRTSAAARWVEPIAGGRSDRAEKRLLRPEFFGAEVEAFRSALRERVVAQEQAVDSVTQAYQIFTAGLAGTDRPLGSFRNE